MGITISITDLVQNELETNNALKDKTPEEQASIIFNSSNEIKEVLKDAIELEISEIRSGELKSNRVKKSR